MTEQVLLLNPRRRSRRMPAGLARYWASRRRRRLPNPRRRRIRARRANPRHRVRPYVERRARRRVYVRGHSSNPRRYRRRRRNPRGEVGTLLQDYLVPAGIGAASAVVLNIGWGYLAPNLPTSVQSGMGALAAQAGIVVVAGAVLSRAMPNASRGITAGVVGALTVIAYSGLSSLLSGTSFAMGDYRHYRMGAYMSPGAAARALPAPMRGRVAAKRGVGWMSPAPALRGLRGPVGAYMTYGGR